MIKPGRDVSLVSWALHTAYMQYIMCILLCLDASVYHIHRCTIWDCDQQIPRNLAVSGLLQVQLQGRVMGQSQLPN